MKKGIIIAIIVIASLGLGYVLWKSDNSAQPAPQTTPFGEFTQVPGESTLQTNMQKAGLDRLSAEGNALHIHQHLNLVINGTAVEVPAAVGIGTTFISPIHTHDTRGVLHVESPVQKDFKLGQFFDEWGIPLSNSCVGTFCSNDQNQLIAAVNGNQVDNIRDHVLASHDEIEIWYGPKTEKPEFIKSYNFEPGE